MMEKQRSYLIDLLTMILYMSLFLISSESFNGQIISVGAAFAALLIVIVDAIRNKGIVRFRMTALHYWMLFFILFCYISALWALRPSLAISKGNTLIKNTICIFLLLIYYYDNIDISHVLSVIMYGGYIMILASVSFFGISALQDTLSSASRLDGSFLNQNTLGMLAAFTILINIWFIIYKKRKYLELILAALSLLVLAAAGSRKSILELVIGALLIFIFHNYNGRKFWQSLCKMVIAIVVLCIVVYFLSKLSYFDFVNSRLENVIHQLTGSGYTDYSVRSRATLDALGWSLFKENPIIGIGIDCARIPALSLTGKDWYLHNNFLELLADGGIVGFSIFYSIYVIIFARFVKYRSERNAEYDICLILHIVQFILGYAYVSYYSRETFFYLMIYFMETEIIKNRKLSSGDSIE